MKRVLVIASLWVIAANPAGAQTPAPAEALAATAAAEAIEAAPVTFAAPLPIRPPSSRPAARAVPDAQPAASEPPPSAATESPIRLARAPLPPARPSASSATGAPALDDEPAVIEAPLERLAPPYAVAPRRSVAGRPFIERRFPSGRDALLPALRAAAEERRAPIDLADAVAFIETRYDPHAVGPSDEIGVMQMRPSIAKDLGFEGDVTALFDPQTNIRLGVEQLARAWERAGGDVCRALLMYRNGLEATRMTPLSAEYCRRATAYLKSIDSALLRDAAPPPAREAGAPTPSSAGGAFNWRDHDQRLRQIDNRWGGQNFGIIAR